MSRGFVALLVPIALSAVGAESPAVEVPKDKRVVAYFTEWGVYGRKYNVGDIPATKVTHINYAFAKVTEQGECVLHDPYAAIDKAYPGDRQDTGVLRGNFNQLQLLK